MLGEHGFVAPDDPPDAGVDEAEFVAGGVDGLDAWELEVPFEAGSSVCERGDEAATCTVDVDWDIMACFLKVEVKMSVKHA
jgi:hypothetical protein